jgi:hypothetical protein
MSILPKKRSDIVSSKKKGHTGPVPPENQPKFGTPQTTADDGTPDVPRGAPKSDQDPQRRLGNYQTAGEHAIQQPGGKNDSDR